jgi:hypothetical protein
METLISALAAVHLLLVAWHASAHTSLAVRLPPEKLAFVYVVIVLAPIVGALLVWTRYLRGAIWLFFVAMLGALVFGAYHHYVLVSPDNVHHLPNGSAAAHTAFISSAAGLAVLELTSALYGAYCLGKLRR